MSGEQGFLPRGSLAYIRGVDFEGNAVLASAPGRFRPVNNTVAAFGDSRIALGVLTVGANIQAYARGLLAWPRTLSRQAFDHNLADNYGVSGAKSPETLAVIKTALPTLAAGTVVVLTGTNDANTYTGDDSISNYRQIQNMVVNQYGKVLIWLNEMPRGAANVLAGTQLSYHLQRSAWLNAQASVPGVYVADTFGPIVDPLAAGADMASGLSADGLHPLTLGAYLSTAKGSGSLLSILNSLFPPRNLLCTSNADAYSATDNPRGVLNANPIMTGTAGTVTAPGAGTMTGNLATSYTATLTNGTGVAVTLSKVTTTSFNGVTYASKDWQQVAITGTPSSAGCVIKIGETASSAASIAAGDNIDQTIEFEVDAAQTGISSIQMAAIVNALNRRDMTQTAATETFPVDAIAGVQRINWIVTSGEASFYKPDVSILLIQSVAVSATVRFRAMAARKVIA